MVRRRVAAGVGVALVIIVALLINGCVKNEAKEALETYAQHVSRLVKESDEQVSHPLFAALASANGQTPLNVEIHISEYREQAEVQANSARALNVPSSMDGAQRDFLLTMDLRVEGLVKVANLVRSALGGQNSSAATQVAGGMEIFLASDVIYSQRVAPLIAQTLAANGITGQAPPATAFLPNLGWLEPSTVVARLGGQQSSASSSGPLAPGSHGSAISGVSVDGTALEQGEQQLNHIKGGVTPTFTVSVKNAGENVETDVKVNVAVTSQGKPFKGSHTIDRTEPGKTVEVAIPVEGVPLAPAKISVEVEPVPGETNHEDTKFTYLAVFEK
jgi:hypothetical protein